jgi:hypothetical protein
MFARLDVFFFKEAAYHPRGGGLVPVKTVQSDGFFCFFLVSRSLPRCRRAPRILARVPPRRDAGIFPAGCTAWTGLSVFLPSSARASRAMRPPLYSDKNLSASKPEPSHARSALTRRAAAAALPRLPFPGRGRLRAVILFARCGWRGLPFSHALMPVLSGFEALLKPV